MTPDDPRHGTNAGYMAHINGQTIVCADCYAGRARYERHRNYDSQLGRARIVPSLGAQRRVKALQCLGWSLRMIAREAGWNNPEDLQWMLHNETCNRRTFDRVAQTYERLSMTIPPLSSATARARNRSRRLGYIPPLAWTNIDDPDENPTGWQYKPSTRATPDRAETLTELVDRGASISEACRGLNLTRDSLWRWCQRQDLAETFERLAAREHRQMDEWEASA